MSSVSDIKLIRTDFFFFFFSEILFSQCAKGHTLHLHYLQCYEKVLRVTSGLQDFKESLPVKQCLQLVTIFFFLFFPFFFLLFLLFKTWKSCKTNTYKGSLVCSFVSFCLCFHYLKLGNYLVTIKITKGRVTPQVPKLSRGKSV